jgi:hypothetical protein
LARQPAFDVSAPGEGKGGEAEASSIEGRSGQQTLAAEWGQWFVWIEKRCFRLHYNGLLCGVFYTSRGLGTMKKCRK